MIDINKFMPPPVGEKWHRESGWEESDLPDGYRPLLAREFPKIGVGDEWNFSARTMWNSCNVDYDSPASESGYFWRTKRPLPASEPEKLPIQWHNPEKVPSNKIPTGWRLLVPEEVDGRYMNVARLYDPYEKDSWSRQDGTGANYSGYTYIVPSAIPLPGQEKKEPADPYAELKKAHAEGKVIQTFITATQQWKEQDFFYWDHPQGVEGYRIKLTSEVESLVADDWLPTKGVECELFSPKCAKWIAFRPITEGVYYRHLLLDGYKFRPITPEQPKSTEQKQPTEKTSTMATIYDETALYGKDYAAKRATESAPIEQPPLPEVGSVWVLRNADNTASYKATILGAGEQGIAMETPSSKSSVLGVKDWHGRIKTQLLTKRELNRRAKAVKAEQARNIAFYTGCINDVRTAKKPSLTRRAVRWFVVKPLKVAAMLAVGAFLSNPIKAGIIGGTAYLWNYVSGLVQK